MKRGKKYIEAAKNIERGNLISEPDVTDVMPISRSEAQLYCRMVLEKRFVS